MFELEISYLGPEQDIEPDDDLFIDCNEDDECNNMRSRSIWLLPSDPDLIFNEIVGCCCKYANGNKEELEALKAKVKDFMAGNQEMYKLFSNDLYQCSLLRH